MDMVVLTSTLITPGAKLWTLDKRLGAGQPCFLCADVDLHSTAYYERIEGIKLKWRYGNAYST